MRKKKYESIHIPNKKLGITDWIPGVDKKFNDVPTHSWFDINFFNNPKRITPKRYTKIIPEIPPDSLKQQTKSIKMRKSDKTPDFLYTEKIRLYPTEYQREILHLWFDAYSEMFNVTIVYLRENIKYSTIDEIKESKKFLNFINCRAQLKEKRDSIKKSINPQIQTVILDEAIHHAISNYKTCLTNYENGNIKQFRIRKLSKNRTRKILKLESLCFNNNTFCRRVFPEMKSSSNLNDITKTSTLQYNSDTKKYILLVPRVMEPSKITKKETSCGIDLGVRTFATVYSPTSVYSICNDAVDNPKIKKCHNKIDRIHELLNLEEGKYKVPYKEKIDGEIVVKRITKKINKTKLKKSLRKYHRKIQNKVMDMHYKTCHKLVHTFDEIFIGELSTKGILSKKNVKITSRTKRMVGVLSPYMFRQRLKYMGYKYGTQVTEVNEYLTTKTCSNCGKINELGAKKIHECDCGMIADRDENAAKNILKVGIDSLN